MDRDPIRTIKEHKKKGYTVELSIDSIRPTYAIHMFTQQDVKRFTIPIGKVSLTDLHDAIRGN